MQRLLFIVVIVSVVWWSTRPPTTEAIALPDGSLDYPGYSFHNAEDYQLEARVLSREDYRLGRESDLSPMDLALGWGVMADPSNTTDIEFSQRSRWYFYRYQTSKLSRFDIQSNSANVHIVAATDAVRRALDSVEEEDLVRLTGKLIDIQGEDGWQWRSSRSRTDTGNGSCELMLVERIDWL